MPTNESSSNSFLEIPHLFQATYIRWKHGFFHYILSYLIVGVVWLGIHIGLLIFSGMIAVLGIIFLRNTLIIPVVLVFGLLTSGVITLYLFSLLILTSVTLLTEKTRGVVSTMRSVQPLVKGYIWVGLCSAFFLSGIFPFGIVSFLIVPILWTFWSSFTTFVYLSHKKGGLQNLWISRSMYNQKFWPLIFRSLIPFIGSLFISVPHVAAVAFFPQQSTGYMFLFMLSYLLNFVYASFVICYNYELYRHLHKPTDVKTPKIWVGVSLFGWVINLLVLVALSFSLSQLFPVIEHYYLSSTSNTSAHKYIQDPNTHYYKTTISQPIQTPDRLFTLALVEEEFPSVKADALPSLEHFMLVNVTIENTSQQMISYNPYDFFVINTNGELYGPTFAFNIADQTMLGSGKLAPGAKKSGSIVFKVMSDTKPYTLLYKPQTVSSLQEFAVEARL